MIKNKRLVIILSLSVLLLFGNSKKAEYDVPITKQKGVCWVGTRQDVEEEQFETLADKNVTWISQTPFGWQESHESPEISMSWRRRNENAPDKNAGLRRNTRLAKKHGIKTILKPHIWLRNSGTHWRGEIAMQSEEDWLLWFKSYEKFILNYAKVAEEEQIEILCIGTELHQTCLTREADWRKLITKVRSIYSGKLTYAANFNQEYEDVRFWDMLDYIGIQAYFPLSENVNPTVDELKVGWKEPVEKLKRFSKKHNKHIIFTEIGYRSTVDAAIEPWLWPQQISKEERSLLYSEQTQARCYEAMFQTVWKEPWLAGLYVWKWYPHYDQIRPRRNWSAQDQKSYFNIDFTPQNKAAEEVMSKWYGYAE